MSEDYIYELAKAIYHSLEDGKALDTKIIDLTKKSSFTDYIIVTSASNERQLKALADRVEIDIKKSFKKLALGVEGKSGGQWVLVDYGDIVIHIFLDEVRDFYRLEDLWHDAPLLKF